jgi:hypothetical protein
MKLKPHSKERLPNSNAPVLSTRFMHGSGTVQQAVAHTAQDVKVYEFSQTGKSPL